MDKNSLIKISVLVNEQLVLLNELVENRISYTDYSKEMLSIIKDMILVCKQFKGE